MDSARGAAHAVTEFFQGNPFATRVGAQVEQATDPTLDGENWALNLAICDLVNGLEEGPRDAIRAIRKRLKDFMGKNNQAVMNTLTVLETCVKNCDRRFHQVVAQKEFVQELVKLIGTKYDPPQAIQEKVLSLIQCWADAFRNQPDLKGVCEMYDELKSKGVEFPMTDLDAMAPIYTPKKSVFTPSLSSTAASPGRPPNSPVTQPVHRGPAANIGAPVHLSPEQLAKLRSELDIVSGNLRVLQEMLSELHPGQEDADDLHLLQDLHNTCRQMQTRMLELLEAVANEEVTSELLVMNDELNNVFSKYDRYMANRNNENGNPQRMQQSPRIPQAASATAAASDTSPPLIDFGSAAEENTDLSQRLAALGTNGGSVSGLPQTTATSTHTFVQTRSQLDQSKQSGSTYYDNSAGLDQTSMSLGSFAQQRSQLYPDGASSKAAGPSPHSPAAMKESDYKEMEGWLQQQGGSGDASGEEQNDEFNKFLFRRAESGAHDMTQQQKPTQTNERLFSL